MTCISWTSQRHTVCGTRRWPRHKLPLWPSTKTDLCLQSSWQIAGVGDDDDHHHHHQFEQNEGIIKLKKWHDHLIIVAILEVKHIWNHQPKDLATSSLTRSSGRQVCHLWGSLSQEMLESTECWFLSSKKTGDTSPVKVSYNITMTYITIFSDISLFPCVHP